MTFLGWWKRDLQLGDKEVTAWIISLLGEFTSSSQLHQWERLQGAIFRNYALGLFSFEVHSLKLTAKAPENRPGPKRKSILKKHPFSGAMLVSGRVTFMVHLSAAATDSQWRCVFAKAFVTFWVLQYYTHFISKRDLLLLTGELVNSSIIFHTTYTSTFTVTAKRHIIFGSNIPNLSKELWCLNCTLPKTNSKFIPKNHCNWKMIHFLCLSFRLTVSNQPG